jgi:membrane protein DedA with SNARE-associated domain
MVPKLKSGWRRTPSRVRKPIVLIVGLLCVITSGLVGWLPGPGGIPLFLIGIAILATEFHWAHRLKVFVLDIVYALGRWYRQHRILGTLGLALLTATSLTFAYLSFRSLFHL